MTRVIGILLALSILIGCGKGDGKGSDEKQAQQEQAKPQSGGQANVKIDGPAQEKAGIRVAKAESRTIPQYLAASGQIVLDEERTAHVGVYTDGRVTDIYANVGDHVTKGAILARMHSHDVHETRAAYESALQEVRRAETAVEYQTRMRDRMRRLFDLKSASKQEVEKAETDLRSAQTDLENARISVAKESAHLTDILNLNASQLQGLNEKTELVPVVAPISGTVIDRKITPGSVVEPGNEVFVVSDLSTVWMMASVSETDIAHVRVGSKARLLTQAYPDEVFPGRITHLGTELDPQTRTLQVRIVLANPANKLRPAMYANAQIEEGHSREAVFVPEEAIQEINGSSVVFVRILGNMFSPRPVEIAHRLNSEAELRAGLSPGDDYVTKGSFVVKSELLKSQIGE